MIALRRPSPWAIGIDVGGTKIAAAAVDVERGTVRHRQVTATQPERGAAAIRDLIEGLASDISDRLHADGHEAGAVGIGVPELVDPQGRITTAYLCDWSAAPLRSSLVATFDSDVRAAACAEATFGAGRPYRLVAYINIGTGISSSLVQDGVPLTGARGGALVLSSGPVSILCARCGAWSAFVLEEYASGAALIERYGRAGGRDVLNAGGVIRAAEEGDPDAVAIVDSAATALGSAIGWLVNVTDPEAVVLGGGLGLAPGRFQERVTSATREHIWNPAARDLPILPSLLGGDAGLIGAALSTVRRRAESDDNGDSVTVGTRGERRDSVNANSRPLA